MARNDLKLVRLILGVERMAKELMQMCLKQRRRSRKIRLLRPMQTLRDRSSPLRLRLLKFKLKVSVKEGLWYCLKPAEADLISSITTII